jgi:hypothetical protein
VLAVLGLVLLFTADIVDFTRPLVVAVLVALGATWIEVTRRQTLREFPDAQGTPFFSDTWERVSGWWRKQWAAVQQPATVPTARPPAAPVPPVAPPTDLASRLTALAELHANGALTDEEFASAKARVLGGE